MLDVPGLGTLCKHASAVYEESCTGRYQLLKLFFLVLDEV